MSDLPLIDGSLKQQLLAVVRREAPNEAAGIIYRDTVYQFDNTSDSPQDSFAFDLGELRLLIDVLKVPLGVMSDEVFIWHSHPAGGVGPSRIDMNAKTPLKHHLVVALVEDDIVATWY